MNAVAASVQTNGCGSDSDTNSDESSEYYQPISAVDDEEEEDEGEFSDGPNFPNGCLENGVSSIDLSDEDNQDEEEEEEATESERAAIERAFREDERRRNAPLTAENAVRVVEAMRQISFGGSTPHWADQVSEDQWIHRLRGLRPPSSSSTTTIHHP